jgi:hypothetical protein
MFKFSSVLQVGVICTMEGGLNAAPAQPARWVGLIHALRCGCNS